LIPAEILMRDRVAPCVELVQPAAPDRKLGPEGVDRRPESQTESAEVVAQRSGCRVLPVELPSDGQGQMHRWSIRGWRGGDGDVRAEPV